MARLVAYLIWLRHFGFFHTAQPPLTYTGLNEVIAKLEAIPQTQPLPLILYRRISSDPIPTFNGPLVKALRKGNGFCVGWRGLSMFKCPECKVPLEYLSGGLWVCPICRAVLSSSNATMNLLRERLRKLREKIEAIDDPVKREQARRAFACLCFDVLGLKESEIFG